MITITGITHIVLDYYIIRSLKLTFSSLVEQSLSSCHIQVIDMGEFLGEKEP
jgi:hypothetical protein